MPVECYATWFTRTHGNNINTQKYIISCDTARDTRCSETSVGPSPTTILLTISISCRRRRPYGNLCFPFYSYDDDETLLFFIIMFFFVAGLRAFAFDFFFRFLVLFADRRATRFRAQEKIENVPRVACPHRSACVLRDVRNV